jgi:hypothetical protein
VREAKKKVDTPGWLVLAALGAAMLLPMYVAILLAALMGLGVVFVKRGGQA